MARIRRSFEQTENKTVWKVGKYIRLSREDENSESITNQRKIIDEKIGEYFENDYKIVDEYIDDGRTGTSDDTRPEFLRLVDDVKSGKINCIITKNLSRAFRNSANQGKFLEEFIPLYSTRFISLYEPHIDTFLNPEVVHSLEVSITGFMNEQYAYKTSLDVRRTFETKRKKGEFIGSFAPYGLMKNPQDKNKLIIDEQAADVVRDIFSWFVNEGMSKSGITKRLNELGIKNPTAYKKSKGLKYRNPKTYENDGLWSERTVMNILTNQMYIGNMVQGRQKVISYKVHDRVNLSEKDWYIVPDTHKAIIDKQTFEKAQKLHSMDTRASPKKRNVYIFSGLLKCADCKKAMTRKSTKNIVYYGCSTHLRKSKTACTKHTIRQDMLEKAVLEALQKQISLVPDLDKIIDDIKNSHGKDEKQNRTIKLLSEKQKEREKLIDLKDNLYIDWRKGEINQTEYTRIKSKLNSQEKQLDTAISNLEREKCEPVAKPYVNEFLKYKNIQHLDRGLLVELVNNIYIHEGGGITIEFDFKP